MAAGVDLLELREERLREPDLGGSGARREGIGAVPEHVVVPALGEHERIDGVVRVVPDEGVEPARIGAAGERPEEVDTGAFGFSRVGSGP